MAALSTNPKSPGTHVVNQQTSSPADTTSPLRPEETLAERDHSSHATVPMERVPYNNGYGDYSFGRLINRYDPCVWYEKPAYLWKYYVAEDFKRSGTFPFFKLPLEIRKKLYRMLIQPVCEDNPHTGKSYLGLRIHRMPNATSIEQSTFDETFAARKIVPGSKLYEQKKSDCNIMMARTANGGGHPERKHLYELRAGRTCCYDTEEGKQWLDDGGSDHSHLEFVRELSNVSTNFRKELGDEQFSRIKLTFYPDHELEWLRGFLEDRPAMHVGIKTLWLSISHQWSINTGQFDRLCNDISKHLNLEDFTIRLDIPEEDLEQFIRAEGLYAHVTNLRKLRVTRTFEVEVRFISAAHWTYRENNYTREGGFGKHHERKARAEERLWKKYKDVVQDLVLPDILRFHPAPPQSDVERYLSSREEPQQRQRVSKQTAEQVPNATVCFYHLGYHLIG